MFIEINKDVFLNPLQVVSYEINHYQVSLTINLSDGNCICKNFNDEKELDKAVRDFRKQLEEAKKSFYSDLRSIIEKAVDHGIFG